MTTPMARRPLVAGNWKMHKTVDEAVELVRAMLPGLEEVAGIDRLVCPPFVALTAVAPLLEGRGVALGAQNMHWEAEGAFTGEVSPRMLAPLCKYVILGHSERRQYFGETDETVNRRMKSALEHELLPVLCIGETLDEREAGATGQIVTRQLRGGLSGLEAMLTEELVVAYEPVWAIGTGKAATPDDANEVISGTIRPLLAELLNPALADSIRILYGGSVNAGNAESFFVEDGIDGALVGGASLDADEFIAIVRAAAFS